MKSTPNQTTHRPLTTLLALAICLTMCLPAAATLVRGAQDISIPTSLTYTYTFQAPALSTCQLGSQAYTQLHVAGAMNMGKDVGGPQIPVTFVQLALPPMTTVDTLTVNGPSETVDTGSQLIEQPVAPFQQEVPVGSDAPTTIAYNPALYQLSTAYPASPYDDSYQIGYCRGYAILSLALMPVQYIPAQGTLSYHPSLTISITLKSAPANPLYRNSANDEFWVSHLVSNPAVVASYRTIMGRGATEYPGGLCDTSHHYDYVIVTTTTGGLDHWDTSDQTPYNWDSLMAEHSDLQCTLVTVQQIDACSDYQNDTPLFNDHQAHLREFCKDAYQDWGTQYILIAGGTTILGRLMTYEYESNVESDIYFSNLDNNFNKDQDSQWGEQGDLGFDLYSELYVGRLTVQTPQDASNWMTKSFKYAAQGDPNILDNTAFYGGEMGWTVGGDEFEDYCAIKGTDNYLGPIPSEHGQYPAWMGFQYGFETWNATYPGIPYNLSIRWTAESSPHAGWKGGNQGAAIAGLRDAINADQVSLISGVAHADPHMSLDVGSSDWRTQYHNTNPFFITDWGCHCGDYDDSNDQLSTMLFYSNTTLAFGCTYNTGYGWGSFTSTNSSSAIQQKNFWDYFFDLQNNSGSIANWQLGKAHAFARDEAAPTVNWTWSSAPGSYRGVIECCLLFADPAQRLKPARENHPPVTPTTPNGPSSGTVAINYTFTTSSTDPDNDPLYYEFNWGDGTTSGWVGPFASGTTGSGSHMWTSGGVFNVSVRAKDNIQAITDWSGTTTITMGAPILQVQKLKGGFSLKVTFINVGDGAAKVHWRVSISGVITQQHSGMIQSIPVNDPYVFKAMSSYFGLGKITVRIEASAMYGNSIDVTTKGFLLGPFILLTK
jgi:hypothetical protein